MIQAIKITVETTTDLYYEINAVDNVGTYAHNTVTTVFFVLRFHNNYAVNVHIFFKFIEINRTTNEYVTAFVSTDVLILEDSNNNVTLNLNVLFVNEIILANIVVKIGNAVLEEPLVSVEHVAIKIPIWYNNHLHNEIGILANVLLEQNLYCNPTKVYDDNIEALKFLTFNNLLKLWFHKPVPIKIIVLNKINLINLTNT